MHYKISKDGFTLWSLLDLQTTKYSKVHIPALFLTMHLILGLIEKYFEPSCKSGPAKTGPAGPVPLPLTLARISIVIFMMKSYMNSSELP